MIVLLKRKPNMELEILIKLFLTDYRNYYVTDHFRKCDHILATYDNTLLWKRF
jgi:hypothetical protein